MISSCYSTYIYHHSLLLAEYNIIIFISTTMPRPLPLGIPNPAGVSIQTNVEHILAATAELLPSCCCCYSVSVSVSGNWSYMLNGMLNTLHSCNLCPNEINLWTSIAKLIRRKPTTTRRRRERLQETPRDSKTTTAIPTPAPANPSPNVMRGKPVSLSWRSPQLWRTMQRGGREVRRFGGHL